ncbi:DUF2092 domain-containing protein [Haloglomus litoreum]|uniref:DUF2092 domain-containing protein n=1 Tax=Haloglomus litoreum TaxID=3034026 RepID=UPI0023E778B8|nr:DUF2092 domain-containing protein [Haloglomus sp. DT116]
MVPATTRAALTAVALGTLVLLSGVGASATVAQQPPAVDRPTHDGQLTTASVNDSTVPDGEEIVERFEQRLVSLETVVMRYEMTMRFGNRTTTTERKLWVDRENDRIRTETETNRTDLTTVRNETAIVTYDAESNQVRRIERSSETTPKTLIGPLVNGSELTYEGRERVGGEPTYRLDAEPTNSAGSGSIDVTLWLDQETYFPTRIATVTETGGDEVTTTIRIRNVTLNEPIPDDRFTIDVPKDADRREHSVPDRSTYDSLPALRENTARSVPEPDIPDAYTFEEGVVTTGADGDSVSLQYAAGDESFRVVTRPATGYDLGEVEALEEVDIGNETGYYTEYEYGGATTAVLVLPCENATHSIYGDLSKDASIDIAESFGCE